LAKGKQGLKPLFTIQNFLGFFKIGGPLGLTGKGRLHTQH